MIKAIRYLFYTVFVKPLVYVCLGINVKNSGNLPAKGPAILVCNHNSHLDTLVLMSLFTVDVMVNISPVAAADYFLSNKFTAWIAMNIFNIIPLNRSFSKEATDNFYEELDKRLKNNSVVILYPEGSRGEPEKMENLKSGIFHIAKKYPEIPVIPCFIHGLGIVLPKNEILLVPAICNIVIEKPAAFLEDKKEYMNNLKNCFEKMKSELMKK